MSLAQMDVEGKSLRERAIQAYEETSRLYAEEEAERNERSRQMEREAFTRFLKQVFGVELDADPSGFEIDGVQFAYHPYRSSYDGGCPEHLMAIRQCPSCGWLTGKSNPIDSLYELGYFFANEAWHTQDCECVMAERERAMQPIPKPATPDQKLVQALGEFIYAHRHTFDQGSEE